MIELKLIPVEEFRRIETASAPETSKLSLIADMCRANALTVVKKAGSGHLGSSFSAMDIVVWLYYRGMNTRESGLNHPGRDIYFSSKGHDVPGLYSVLYSLGFIPEDRFLKLRRRGGLDGHPDIRVPGIEANSGSLGMGISKARGMAWAKRLRGLGGRVFVMTGDGEFQEGQNFEALQATRQQGVTNLTVIMDHNTVQSDKPVSEIVSIEPLEEKIRFFGWHVERCPGHDIAAIGKALELLKGLNDKPGFLIADTIKGRGVSFMEHPRALRENGGLYRWHAGAPADDVFAAAHAEILGRLNGELSRLGLPGIALRTVAPAGDAVPAVSLAGEQDGRLAAARPTRVTGEYVADAYGDALVELAARRKDLVVLDADLAADCRVRKFEQAYPDRFIENGIAEQDMVSMAGGLARMGLLPVVNSFASFLASRANEQIYNNATENAKIIYACHYAGLIPAGPGKSHQSLRDVSLLGALPGVLVAQPCNGWEARALTEYFVEHGKGTCVLRMNIGPSPRAIVLPEGYIPVPGRGVRLTEGDRAMIIGYGPVLLHEALLAGEILRPRGIGVGVVNLPWVNTVDADWLDTLLGRCPAVFVLDDHAPFGALGDAVTAALQKRGRTASRIVEKVGVEGFPECGTPPEVLRFHGLSGASLADRVARALGERTP